MNIEYFDQSETNDIEVSLLVSLSVQISNLSSLFLFKRSHIPFHFKLGLFQLLTLDTLPPLFYTKLYY